MNGFFPLLRLQLLSRFADLKPRNMKAAMKSGRKGRTVGMIAAILFLLLYLGGILIFIEKKMLDVLLPAGMGYLLVNMAVTLTMAGTLVLAFFFIMSSLYMGRDAAFIAAMPVKARTVLSAKLAQVWLSETCIDAIILLPACIQYGVRSGVDAGFYLRLVVVWLFAAMMPIAIITFVSALLVRISALWKHRELVTTVGGIAFFVAYMILMMNVGQITGDSAEGGNVIGDMVMNNSAQIKNMSSAFPPAAWATEGMLGDWGQLGLFALVSVASIAVTVWLMGYVYRKLSLLQAETPEARSKKGIRKGAFQEGNALKANIRREFTQIIRVPSYATNILPIVFMPLLMTIMMTVFIGNNMGDDGKTMKMFLEEIVDNRPALVMGIIAAIMAYMSGMNPALSTAVSREGKGHDFLTGLPVSPQTLIRAKFIVGFGLSEAGILAASIAMGIIFPFAIPQVILAFILCSLFSYGNSCMALSHDVKHPKLNWVTEQEAVKQNYGVLLSMLISWGILVALAGASYFMIKWEWNVWVIFGVLALILGIIGEVSRAKLFRNVDRYYCVQ